MARIINDSPVSIIQLHVQATHPRENTRPSTNNPIKEQEPNNTHYGFENSSNSGGGGFFFKKLFYFHLVLIFVFVIFLTVRGLISATHHHRHHHFHPLKWYPPILVSSVPCAAILALLWQCFTFTNPSRTLRAAFWLSPILTCAVGILLVSVGSAPSLAAAAVALLSAAAQSLYSCWASPRFNHAVRVLSVSTTPLPAKTTAVTLIAIAAGALYSSFVVAGIGGATATTGKGFDSFTALFIFVLLLSLIWTMHVVKNTLQVTISRVKYLNLAFGSSEINAISALFDTVNHCAGGVCVGSVLVPILGLLRGSARAVSLVSGDSDEFMFSCASCCLAVGSRMIRYGNRWGFVHIGVYNKGFVRASMETWEMFGRVGMEQLIDADLTGSFCFLCGVAGGSVCALVGGSWALVLHRDYATQAVIYAFLIGYFMCRVGMAGPQACVSAYHVAYAENSQSLRFDSTIPVRIQELQRSRIQQQNHSQSTTHPTEF